MTKPKNTLAPLAGAGADVPALATGVAAATLEVRTTESPERADEIRKLAGVATEWAKATLKGEDALAALLELAECHAWASRRVGELHPATAGGTRTDLKGDATSVTMTEVETNVAENVLKRCRALAGIPIAAFEDALAGARVARRPITQTALLKLAPPAPRRSPSSPPKPARAPAHGVSARAVQKAIQHALDVIVQQIKAEIPFQSDKRKWHVSDLRELEQLLLPAWKKANDGIGGEGMRLSPEQEAKIAADNAAAAAEFADEYEDDGSAERDDLEPEGGWDNSPAPSPAPTSPPASPARPPRAAGSAAP